MMTYVRCWIVIKAVCTSVIIYSETNSDLADLTTWMICRVNCKEVHCVVAE